MSGGTLKAKMRRVLLAAGVVAAALSISACLPAVTAGTQAGAARPWEVRFESSGGIAGMVKQMTVFHDGRLVAENLRRRVRVEKSLPSDRLRELHRLIEQAESAPGTAMGFPDRCADCTQYRLTVTGSEGRPAVSESGVIEGLQSRNSELIKFLIAILNEAIQP